MLTFMVNARFAVNVICEWFLAFEEFRHPVWVER